MSVAACPLCDANIPIPRSLLVGSMLFCPRCDCLLQIVSLEPPTGKMTLPFPTLLGPSKPESSEPSALRRARQNELAEVAGEGQLPARSILPSGWSDMALAWS